MYSILHFHRKFSSGVTMRKEAIEKFGEKKSLENLGNARKKLVLDVLR